MHAHTLCQGSPLLPLMTKHMMCMHTHTHTHTHTHKHTHTHMYTCAHTHTHTHTHTHVHTHTHTHTHAHTHTHKHRVHLPIFEAKMLSEVRLSLWVLNNIKWNYHNCFLGRRGIVTFHYFWHLPSLPKALIHFQTQSDDPISCHGKPLEWTNEIVYPMISLVRSTGFQ